MTDWFRVWPTGDICVSDVKLSGSNTWHLINPHQSVALDKALPAYHLAQASFVKYLPRSGLAQSIWLTLMFHLRLTLAPVPALMLIWIGTLSSWKSTYTETYRLSFSSCHSYSYTVCQLMPLMWKNSSLRRLLFCGCGAISCWKRSSP